VRLLIRFQRLASANKKLAPKDPIHKKDSTSGLKEQFAEDKIEEIVAANFSDKMMASMLSVLSCLVVCITTTTAFSFSHLSTSIRINNNAIQMSSLKEPEGQILRRIDKWYLLLPNSSLKFPLFLTVKSNKRFKIEVNMIYICFSIYIFIIN
jgi:hypothetical protein